MKNIFLSSSVNFVAHDIAKHLPKPVKGSKLLFVTTSVEVEQGDLQWFKDDRNSLVKCGFDVINYTFTGKAAEEIKNQLDHVDILYISGGNQFYLLKKIQETGCAQIIKDFVSSGKPYIGCSAGSVVAGPNIEITKRIDEADFAQNLTSFDGLSLVDFIIFPHWGSGHFKHVYLNYRLDLAYGTEYKIILLTDTQYVWVKDEWYQIIDTQ